MLYVRKIEIVTENDTVVFKSKQKEAIQGLSEALAIVKCKEGEKKKTLLKTIKRIDKEFKEFYDLR